MLAKSSLAATALMRLNPRPKGHECGQELDGSAWALEVSDASGYTVEDVANPLMVTDGDAETKKNAKENGFNPDAFVAVCKFLIRCAPMDPDGIY